MHKFRLYKSVFWFLTLTTISVGFSVGSPAFADSSDLYNQPFLSQIKAVTLAKTGNSVTIAVIDEGIDFTQPDLTGTDDGNGQNFYSKTASLTPLGHHGTEIAGVIKAASLNNSEIKFMNLIACSGTDGCDENAIIKSIYFAADHGARVINLSLAVTSANGYLNSFSNAIAYAYKKNVIVVAASGNGDSNQRAINLSIHPVSPVCNDGSDNMVIGVSSVDVLNNPEPWANFGGCVDVAAPGGDIYTASDPVFNYNEHYTYENGTSFSAAIVSSLAAEVLIKNPKLTAPEVTSLIKSNAAPLSETGFGSGIVNIKNTLLAAASPLSPSITVPQISSAQTINYSAVKKAPAVKLVTKPAAAKQPKFYPRGMN